MSSNTFYRVCGQLCQLTLKSIANTFMSGWETVYGMRPECNKKTMTVLFLLVGDRERLS